MFSKITKNHVILFFVSLIFIVLLVNQYTQKLNLFKISKIIKFNKDINESADQSSSNIDDNYLSKCVDLFKKLRYPNQSLIIRPPPAKPPADMILILQ